MKEYKLHLKQTMILAYPVIIGQLGFILMGVVDSVMVGELGASPLAAASVANGLIMFVFVAGIGVSFAITPLVAIAVGARRFDDCGVIFRQALLVDLIFGIILFVVAFIGANLIQYLDQPPDVVELATSYGELLAFSIIPAMLFQTYKQFIEGLSVMRPAMVIVLFANLINAFVNWILIFGNLGFPALGLDGAGWATLASRIFMGFTLAWYVMNQNRFKQYDVTLHFRSINFKMIKRLLGIGLPSAVQYLFEVGAFFFAVIMVGWLGTKQLAAHQIAINLASISFMTALGVSAAGSIRVANRVGKQNISETRKAGFSAIVMGASIMACFGLIFIILRNFLPTLYIDDSNVITIASSLLVIAALFQIADGVQAVGIGVLRGLTDVKWPTLITFIAYWILGLPSAYVLGFIFKYDVQGVWVGLLIGLLSSAIMLSTRFNKKSKQIINI